jgi:hypothetical protein
VSVLAVAAEGVEDPHVSSYEYVSAPRAVTVLPKRVGRRITRRDALLPLVLALELVTGIAFGLASHAGDDGATSVPAKVSLGPVNPMAHVVGGTTQPLAAAGPVAPTPVGPAVGPLLPGQVRPVVVAPVQAAPVTVVASEPAAKPYPKHAPRDPFASLVTTP